MNFYFPGFLSHFKLPIHIYCAWFSFISISWLLCWRNHPTLWRQRSTLWLDHSSSICQICHSYPSQILIAFWKISDSACYCRPVTLKECLGVTLFSVKIMAYLKFTELRSRFVKEKMKTDFIPIVRNWLLIFYEVWAFKGMACHSGCGHNGL